MMQVDVGDQEEKVALASRARLQETFTKDVIETTKCQVIMIMIVNMTIVIMIILIMMIAIMMIPPKR